VVGGGSVEVVVAMMMVLVVEVVVVAVVTSAVDVEADAVPADVEAGTASSSPPHDASTASTTTRTVGERMSRDPTQRCRHNPGQP
jgi:hypothetical protein